MMNTFPSCAENHDKVSVWLEVTELCADCQVATQPHFLSNPFHFDDNKQYHSAMGGVVWTFGAHHAPKSCESDSWLQPVAHVASQCSAMKTLI